jgi:vacuolar protein sorting-associated protein 45
MDGLLEDIRSALGRGTGIKALLLDEFTRDAISPVISHSELLSYDFFLFENICNLKRQAIDVSCVAILSKSSLSLLIREIEKQTYKEYYVFITDELTDVEISAIAEKDSDCVIKELQELYVAGTPVDSRFLILNGLNDEEIAQSLGCFIRGLSVNPGIRYLFGTEVCYKTAEKIGQIFKLDSTVTDADLLIVDRAVDLFTPLQYPWTYQSMAAEYLEYRAGIISWGRNNIFISKNDRFYEECKFRDIVYATESLKESLEEVNASRGLVGEFVTNVRERAEESSRLTMHLKALGEISKLCLENNLVSEIMADLIEGVPVDLLESARNASEEQKLRLALIEYLCECIPQRKNILRAFWKEKKPKWVLFDGYKKEIKKYSEKFLKNKNIYTKQPVYRAGCNRKTGYIPGIVKIVDNFKKNRLCTKRFPVVRNGPYVSKKLIIFITGGATFIEYRALINLFSENYPNDEVVLISDKLITGKGIISDLIAEVAEDRIKNGK